MGFETGNILEPSMGVGNFFGMLPEEMRNSRLYGVELDPVSGRIAKQLSSWNLCFFQVHLWLLRNMNFGKARSEEHTSELQSQR